MAFLFTLEFLQGFWLFFILYWLLAPLPRVQNVLLLLGGYYFLSLVSLYSLLVLWGWSACVWLVLKRAVKKGGERQATALFIVLMLMAFFVFKYCMPSSEWLRDYLAARNIPLSVPVINLLLPLGLSFYRFNSVSLVRSVAKKEIVCPDLLSLLLYISFAPTLIAGPVNRALALLPQIQATRRTMVDFKKAIFLIALALIKLFLLSSWLNETLVMPVFSLPEEQNGWDTLIAVYGWAWNIYFNFSGYTHFVTGLAMLLGYRLAPNFDHPYLATSLQHFWRGWHISLSNFIRDYLYFPLGGSRVGFARTQLNIMVAMILSGIWHGAGMNFLLWGAIHGAGLVMFNLWQRWGRDIQKGPMPELLARFLTFHYVCFAWIFFRADSVDDALTLLTNLKSCNPVIMTSVQLWTVLAFTSVLVIYPWIVAVRRRGAESLAELKWYAVPLLLVPLLTLAFYLAPSGVPGFIYANF